MNRFKQGLFACLALALSAASIAGEGVETFATLPDGVRFPEGITANPATGDIFVATFDFGPNANTLLRYDRDGRRVAQRDFGATPLLGLAFGPADGKVYLANFGASMIQRIVANFDSGSAIEDVAAVPMIGAPANRIEGNPDGSTDLIQFGSNAFPAPNAMAFDQSGNLYVSDSFQGAIHRIAGAHSCAAPCPAVTLVHDPLLATAGFPPFGANGLALSEDESTLLFVANTGDDRILRVDLAAGTVSVHAESVNGADGMALDRRGTLWVAANQSDEIVGLNDAGRVVARIGGFEGLRHGAPRGLLFPASIVILGHELYVTNLALALTSTPGDEWEEDVTRWTISRVRLPRH